MRSISGALRRAAQASRGSSYAPAVLQQAPDDLLQRVQQLYAQDAQLHALWSAAMDARGMASPALRQNPAELGQLAARFLAQPQGPRIAMLETAGWDTHSARAPRLANQLKALDAMIAALRDGLGALPADPSALATRSAKELRASCIFSAATAHRCQNVGNLLLSSC